MDFRARNTREKNEASSIGSRNHADAGSWIKHRLRPLPELRFMASSALHITLRRRRLDHPQWNIGRERSLARSGSPRRRRRSRALQWRPSRSRGGSLLASHRIAAVYPVLLHALIAVLAGVAHLTFEQ